MTSVKHQKGPIWLGYVSLSLRWKSWFDNSSFIFSFFGRFHDWFCIFRRFTVKTFCKLFKMSEKSRSVNRARVLLKRKKWEITNGTLYRSRQKGTYLWIVQKLRQASRGFSLFYAAMHEVARKLFCLTEVTKSSYLRDIIYKWSLWSLAVVIVLIHLKKLLN